MRGGGRNAQPTLQEEFVTKKEKGFGVVNVWLPKDIHRRFMEACKAEGIVAYRYLAKQAEIYVKDWEKRNGSK